MLATVAACADGWNTCWAWTFDAYRERLAVLERACAAVDRDPATVWKSLGLYALVGEDEADLAARFARLQGVTPKGVLDGTTLAEWRVGRLVGTAEEVREQAAGVGGARRRDHHRRRRCRPLPGRGPRRRRRPRRGARLSSDLILDHLKPDRALERFRPAAGIA